MVFVDIALFRPVSSLAICAVSLTLIAGLERGMPARRHALAMKRPLKYSHPFAHLCWLPHGIIGVANNHGSTAQEELIHGLVPGWI